ncbi:hypothetical protein N5J44_06225 [Acinetobacter ursingii]|uniref:hypothetical protein n=1 Tax=Acinetobacter ursingii TaxID=108980 RepID=UPI0024498722|nr:hypothetical protein [Acinetobacter ursingii]MDH2018880.1 hypothetical protein [Acinetobacter ursingii]MDH2071147.1 hypothetical protein [Acinetobacter ursingii]
MSENKIIAKIEKLQNEILNQYIVNFYNISKHLKWMKTVACRANFVINLSDETLNSLFTTQEQKHIKALVQDDYNSDDRAKAIFDLLNKKKFLNLLSYSGIDLFTDVEREVFLEIQEKFNQSTFDEIYHTMLSEQNNEDYSYLSDLCGFSVTNLIELLDKTKILKNKVNVYKDSIVENEFDNIFNKYTQLDFFSCGFGDKSFEKKIKSAKSMKRNYYNLIEEKTKLLFSVLLDIQLKTLENKKNKDGDILIKWKNPSHIIKKNIDEIKNAFCNFDIKWIENKIYDYEKIIIAIDEGDGSFALNRADCTYIIDELKAILNKGYPFEELKDQLPYSTYELEEVLIKKLKREGLKLEPFLISEYFLKN